MATSDRIIGRVSKATMIINMSAEILNLIAYVVTVQFNVYYCFAGGQ